ncbi:signal transduction histidine kinase [Aequitasia blattaphilus]|uniref:histidine kinase n=1 Tax=Aequitasia blattaphilus TaxID=2949332 RepID=A0ABT1E615_9FIRM|nr:histidine kinase [Aequitasia blattaphilus]MCP1101284.1 histidine kinase [Aequitasia blattaphilus]MCR8613924.1 histidine kinase [Aequitasia blattaphilus]
MKSVIDQVILLLYCITSAFIIGLEDGFIIAFLLVVLYGAIDFCVNYKTGNLVVVLVYLVSGLINPIALLFIPVIFYGALRRKNTWVILPLAGVYIYQWGTDNIQLTVFLVLGLTICLLFHHQTMSYEKLKNEYIETRDTGVEKELLLKEKNRAILSNKEYEIHNATLKERNRIAREIHDNVGHMLSRAILINGAILSREEEGAKREGLAQLKDTLDQAMTSIRESVHDLHDESIDLRSMFERITREFDFCPVTLKFEMEKDVKRELKYTFLSILKEGLSNVAKHSDATEVKVSLIEHPSMYQFIIEDNGQKPGNEGEGIGLMNMEDRVEGFKGTMRIQKEKGFRIFITIPIHTGRV